MAASQRGSGLILASSLSGFLTRRPGHGFPSGRRPKVPLRPHGRRGAETGPSSSVLEGAGAHGLRGGAERVVEALCDEQAITNR